MDDNPLTAKLRPHVAALTAAANAGDAKAANVILLYRMHCSAPSDPGAFAFCNIEADEWISRQGGRDDE